MPLKSGLQENKRRQHSQPHDETSEKSSVILSAKPPPTHLFHLKTLAPHWEAKRSCRSQEGKFKLSCLKSSMLTRVPL